MTLSNLICCTIISLLLVAYSAIAVKADDGLLQVHLVPHSHCDVGYRATPQLYTTVVDEILRSITDELSANPAHKFNWVEIYFLQHWWNTTSDAYRSKFKTLVSEGRMELILSGYVMNDEAITYYAADIDQLTVGNQWVLQTFGVVPKYGWQIDPFGASQFTPTMFAKAGFQAMVFNRIDYRTKVDLKANKSLEFWWTPEPARPSETIFAHILDEHYSVPEGFSWEFDYVLENPPISKENVANRSAVFASLLRQRGSVYRSGHLLFPFGSDFRYVNAPWEFFNMDQIVAYINARPDEFGMVLQYSTLTDYFSAVIPQSTAYPHKVAGDYFPYKTSQKGAYWAGFYRSYPGLKIASRSTDATIHAADMLFSQAVTQGLLHDTNDVLLSELRFAREQAAIVQHHDAMPGTCLDFVVVEYLKLLREGGAAAHDVSGHALNALLHSSQPVDFSAHDSETVIPSSSLPVFVTFVNALYRKRLEVIRLIVDSNEVAVMSSSGEKITSQITPSFSAAGQFELSFILDADPASVTVFTLVSGSSVAASCVANPSDSYAVSNSFIKLAFDGVTHSLVQLNSIPVTSGFYVYSNTTDDDVYVFRPKSEASPIDFHGAQVEVCTGPVSSEVRQGIERFSQVYRIYNSGVVDVDAVVDIGYTVGPLDLWTNIAYRFTADSLHNVNQSLVTDDNGFFIMRRCPLTAEYRPEDLGGMFFPTTALTYIEDHSEDLRLSAIVGSPVGVASMGPGLLELIVHRRMDIPSRGDDASVITDHVQMILDNIAVSEARRVWLQQRVSQPIQVFTSRSAPGRLSVSGVQSSTDGNLHVLSTQMADDKQMWLRLENLDSSAPITVDVRQLYPSSVSVASVQEFTVTFTAAVNPSVLTDSLTVEIGPRDIRSFVVTFV